jgi:hypothetical protein
MLPFRSIRLPFGWPAAGLRALITASIVAALTALCPNAALAQERSSLWTTTKQVVCDPTTYSPSILAYTAQRLDWDSSQIFFEHGVTEHNPAFTISGRPDDVPLSYAAGNAVILKQSLIVLETSVLNNVSEQLIERLLVSRHPEHRRLFHTLGWIERISVAGYISYQTSALHFSQWQVNQQVASQRGYR